MLQIFNGFGSQQSFVISTLLAITALDNHFLFKLQVFKFLLEGKCSQVVFFEHVPQGNETDVIQNNVAKENHLPLAQPFDSTVFAHFVIHLFKL